MRTDVTIEVVVLCHKQTGTKEIVLLSDVAGGNQSAELWRGQTAGEYAVYHQDMYYNTLLKERRARGLMFHPDKKDRLVLIGNLWGAPNWDPQVYWEMARSVLVLNGVVVDEI